MESERYQLFTPSFIQPPGWNCAFVPTCRQQVLKWSRLDVTVIVLGIGRILTRTVGIDIALCAALLL